MEAAEKFELIKSLKNQLDEYIQKKADFLAEITTEPLATTKSAFLYRDVIVPFITNTLLTDNLARNEGIGYNDLVRNRLRIRVIINNKELKAQFVCTEADSLEQHIEPPKYTYPEALPYTLRCIHETKSPPGISDKYLCKNPAHASISDNDGSLLHIVKFENGDEDVEIELPGPLGEYAFYAFLENLIRNAAKHNKKVFDVETNRNLDIWIRISESIEEAKQDLYEAEVFDNVSDPDFVRNANADGNSRTLLGDIQELIKHRIIDEDFANLVRQAWGIAEMKICAMLLKGMIDFEELETCLKAESCEFNGKRLCYKFDLMKPKKLCALAPARHGGIDPNRLKALERNGIWILKDIAGFEEYVARSSSIASFRFFLLDYHGSEKATADKPDEPDKADKADTLDHLIHKLPFRIIISHSAGYPISEALKRLVDCGAAIVTHEVPPYEKDSSEIMSWIWRVWLRRWLKRDDEAAILEVFLDQEQDLSPSKEWIEHARAFNLANQNNGIVKVSVRARNEQREVIRAEGEPDWNGRHIFYDRHGGALSSLQTNENFLGEHTYIFLDKLNSDFVRIFQPTFQENWLLPYELAEAGMLRVLIVDERMAERCLREVPDSSTQTVARYFTGKAFATPLTWHLAFGAKLYIATHFGFNEAPTPLHQDSYERAMKQGTRLLPFLKMKVEEKSEQPYRITYEWSTNRDKNVRQELEVDALIIHQGILDHLAKIKSQDFLTSFLTDIRCSIPFVVVDSGRGIPPSLPPTAKFLPFSVLQDYVVGKRPAKYGLTQVMMALTRRQRER